MQVDATRGWLIEALQATGGVELNAIPIQSDGTYNTAIQVQTRGFSFTATGLPLGQLVISPDNSNIFLALGTAGTLVVPFNPSVTTANPNPMGANGNLIAVAHTGGSAQSVAVDPTNRLFYVGETLGNSAGTSGGLRVFNYSTARSTTVTSVANSPFASGGLSPNSILPLANGNYVYVANGAGNNAAGNIAAFAVSNTGTDTAPVYAVTAGPTITAGTLPHRAGRGRHRSLAARRQLERRPLLRFLHIRCHDSRHIGCTGGSQHRSGSSRHRGNALEQE